MNDADVRRCTCGQPSRFQPPPRTTERRCEACMFQALAAHLPRASSWSWETFPTSTPELRRSLAEVRAWWEVWEDEWLPTNLFLHGPPGTGKTGLAWCIARSDFELSGVPSFVNVRRWLADRRRSIEQGAPEWDEWGEPLPDPYGHLATSDELLVLDDLGAERLTAFALEEIAGLVESRYDRLGPWGTIVTSNYSPAELARRLGGRRDEVAGERIVSRLLDGATRIELAGRNVRLAGLEPRPAPLRAVENGDA